MNMMLWFLLLMIVSSLVIGLISMISVEVSIEIKRFSHPYFHIGVFFNEFTTEDPEYVEQELKIGLFLINIVFVFYKENN